MPKKTSKKAKKAKKSKAPSRRTIILSLQAMAPAGFSERHIAEVVDKMLKVGQADAEESLELEESDDDVDLAVALDFSPCQVVSGR